MKIWPDSEDMMETYRVDKGSKDIERSHSNITIWCHQVKVIGARFQIDTRNFPPVEHTIINLYKMLPQEASC